MILMQTRTCAHPPCRTAFSVPLLLFLSRLTPSLAAPRPCAPQNFLESLRNGTDWYLTMLHYRNHGGQVGKVLAGVRVPNGEEEAFTTMCEVCARHRVIRSRQATMAPWHAPTQRSISNTILHSVLRLFAQHLHSHTVVIVVRALAGSGLHFHR